MWYKNVGRSFFRFVAIHAFDRETDGQTDMERKALEIPCVALAYMQSHVVSSSSKIRGKADFIAFLYSITECLSFRCLSYIDVHFVNGKAIAFDRVWGSPSD